MLQSEHMNTDKVTDFIVYMKEIIMMNTVLHGVAKLLPPVRQECYSSQILKIKEINEAYNWVSYCIPLLQERCRVSERPRKLKYGFSFSDPDAIPLTVSHKFMEKCGFVNFSL